MIRHYIKQSSNYLNHYYLNMKIVFKGNQSVKMYSGTVTFEEISNFVNKEFPTIQNWTLSFEDEEGDAIMITSDFDLSVMTEMFPNREFIKVNIDTSVINEKEEKEKEEHVQEQKVEAKEEQMKEESSHSDGEEKGKKKKCKDPRAKKFKKFQKLAEKKINKIVEEKIAMMIPCIINQIQNPKPASHPNEAVTHENISCNGCNMNPIKGIRYKCLECFKFNLCQTCQQKIQHEHDLLKMKKYEGEEKNDEKFMKKFMKAGKKFVKHCMRSHSSSSSSRERSHKKDKKSHKRHHKKHEKQSRKIEKRRAEKMVKAFGGELSEYEGFVENTKQMPIKDVLALYAKENNLTVFEDRQNERNKKRMRKLALFFNKDQEEFAEVVQENPDKNFRELLKVLKEQGKYEFDLDNEAKIYSVESKFKWERKGEKTWQKQVKKSKLMEEKKVEEKKEQAKEEESKPETPLIIENLEKKVSEEKSAKEILREKGRILMEMKELFGEEKSKDLFKFIEENYDLGQDRIVEKWIVMEFEKNQK